VWSFDYVTYDEWYSAQSDKTSIKTQSQLLISLLGVESIAKADFTKLITFRTRNAVNRDTMTRLCEYVGFVNTENTTAKLSLIMTPGVAQAKQVTFNKKEITVNGEIIDICTVDMNLNIEDEIAVLYKTSDGKYHIDYFTRDGKQFSKLSIYSTEVESANCTKIFTQRVTNYYNKALNY